MLGVCFRTLPFLTVFMWWSGDLKLISELFKRIFKQPWMFAWLLFSSVCMYHAVVAIFMGAYEWSWPTGVAWLFFAAFGHGVGRLHPLQGKNYPAGKWPR